MKFRPCIDIHDGAVKQIVGGTLSDLDEKADGLSENFVSSHEAAYYAAMYREDGLKGGHIIILNKAGTPEYEASKQAAFDALAAYPQGMQIGGGINADNALEYISAGASHVIVTSFVFKDGMVDYDALKAISPAVGREHLVLDLSCKRVGNEYFIATDRWQHLTEERLNYDFMDEMADYCDEFLVHGADVEGLQGGIDRDLVGLLAGYKRIPVTYAGGIRDFSDIQLISYLSENNLDFTVGSALDIFGGSLSYKKIISEV